METEIVDGARDLLESGTSVWSGWVSRSLQPPLPPAAAHNLMLKLSREDNMICIYASGLPESSDDRLVAGVWPADKLPRLGCIKSKHAYCVTAAPVVDATLILRHDENMSPHPGAIKCSAIRTRTAAELAQLRDGAYPGIRKGQVVTKTAEVKSEPIKNSSKPDSINKGGAIASMFAKQASSSSIKTETTKTVPEPTKEEKKKDNETIEKTNKNSQTLKRSLNTDETRSNNSNQSSQKKVKVVEKKKSKTNKKRKRIEVADSDDSDDSDRDIFESDCKESPNVLDVNFEEEDVIPSTPEVKMSKLLTVNPQRRKKDKTFMGDDGYFYTVKNVLCSDDEANPDDHKENQQKENYENVEEIPNTPENINEKSNSKVNEKPSPVIKTKSKTSKKTPPPNQGKQSNIMNFFKKK